MPGMDTIYTPSELNHEARLHLEAGFGLLWVEGEISNLSRPSSGHVYFSLKDDMAQINCALFRSHARALDFVPENGMQVRAHGRLSLYEARGNYQLIADSMIQSGEGVLQAKFEQLKKQLAAEGLFNSLETTVFSKYPLIEMAAEGLKKAGAIGVLLSGSGASIFGLAESEEHARNIERRVQEDSDFSVWSAVVETLPDGVMVAHGPLEARV